MKEKIGISSRLLSAFVLSSSLMVLTLAAGSPAQAKTMEVLHWWTSGSEARSLIQIKKSVEKRGYQWQDSPIAGAPAAMTVLKSRVIAGNPPAAAQLKGPRLQEFAQEDLLLSLNDVAIKNHWDQAIPNVIRDVVQYKGTYVGVPVNVHRGNWMWVNVNVFKKAHAKIPKSWDEFFQEAPKIQKAGFIPLALGGEKWQESTLFEAIVLSQGGDFYKKLFVDKDASVFKDPRMEKTLDIFKRAKKFIDKNSPGRTWDVTLNLVISGKAAMQIMGDWAKGEFTLQGKKYLKDYQCVEAPGTSNSFTFIVDSFAMFKGMEKSDKGKEGLQGQKDLAEVIMTKEVQEAFNLEKGSIPARTDIPDTKFDPCSKLSMKHFHDAGVKGTLLPSFAAGMTLSPDLSGSIEDFLSTYFYSDLTPKEAVLKLSRIYLETVGN